MGSMESPPPTMAGIGVVGRALKDSVAEVMAAFVERLSTDAAVPEAERLGPPDLEDHGASLLIDIAQSLITSAEEDADVDVDGLLRDGSEIQRVISALHGAQRARLTWREDGLAREFRILREEVAAAVRRNTRPGEQIESGLDLVDRALEQAFRISREHLRAGR